MMARPWRFALTLPLLFALLFSVVLLLGGCPHEPDAAPGALASSPAPGTGDDAAALALGDASAGDASAAAPPDAAPEAETPPPASNAPDMSAAPAYPPSALYEAFSSAKAKLIACYLPGKKRDPKLRGKVIVKFTVNTNGSVKPAANEGSTLEDEDVIACVVRTVKTMHFQKPIEGSVTVVYPLIFHSTGDEILILPDAGKKPSP
jgi:hypothetical protein